MLLPQDHELLARFRAGDDPIAFARIYQHYFESVRRAVRASVARRRPVVGLEVDDLTQEVFAKAFSASARADYDGLRPYERYLAAIANDVAATVAVPRGTHCSDLPLARPSPEAAQPPPGLLELADDYARAMGLSRREAAVLRLHISDKRNKEIAADLGIAHATVRQYWSRICTKIGCRDATGVFLSFLRDVHRRLGGSEPCKPLADTTRQHDPTSVSHVRRVARPNSRRKNRKGQIQ